MTILTYYIIGTLLLIAYLLGSIPSAVWIGKKYYGIDIREHGSKNAGTTNMLRVLGKRAAIPVFALDFLKGFAAVTIVDVAKFDAYFDGGPGTPNDNWFYVLRFCALLFAVLGHLFPVFAGFRGGKGVATLFGGVMAINAPLVLLSFGVWFVVLIVTHYMSLASMMAGISYPIFAVISPRVNKVPSFLFFAVVLAVLLIYTHRKNIKRLLKGTESKIYIWRSRKAREAMLQTAQKDEQQEFEDAVEDLVEEFLDDQPRTNDEA